MLISAAVSLSLRPCGDTCDTAVENIFNQLPSYDRWVQHSLLTDSTLLQKAICEQVVSATLYLYFLSQCQCKS